MPSLGTTLGAIELGGIFATFSFGIVSMQVYNYFRDYPNDGRMLKSMVISTWLFELLHTILLWHTIYSLTITFFCEPERVFTPPQTFYFTILFSTFINATIFLARRIQLLFQRWLVPVVVCILVVVLWAGMMAAVVLLCVHNTLEILKTYRWLAATWIALTAFVDLLILVSMCYWLWRVRPSHSPQTTRIIDTLITWSVESTVIKSGASIIQLVLFLTHPDDFLWIIFFLPRASLFSNSMLASLNGRQRLTSAADAVDGTFIDLNVATGIGPGLEPQRGLRSRNVVIHMTRMTETHIEDRNDDSTADSKTNDSQK
ncbi:hypothetical protein K438DRAFT_1955939 [Mycena galopus ATCC 62051]|nr:hypothetical protein K438DRAFT_1955939 [Mycena galopus ATCC 62051]